MNIRFLFVFTFIIPLLTFITITTAHQESSQQLKSSESESGDSTPDSSQSEFNILRARTFALAFATEMARRGRGGRDYHMERTQFQPIQPISNNDVSNDLDIQTIDAEAAPARTQTQDAPNANPPESILTRRSQNKRTKAKRPTHLTIPILTSPPALPPFRSIANAKSSFIQIFKSDNDVPFGILTTQPTTFHDQIPIIDANMLPAWERALLEGDFNNAVVDLTIPSPNSAFQSPEIPTTNTKTQFSRKKRSASGMPMNNIFNSIPQPYQMNEGQGQRPQFNNIAYSPIQDQGKVKRGRLTNTVEWGAPPASPLTPQGNIAQRQGPIMNLQNHGQYGSNMGQPQYVVPQVNNNNFPPNQMDTNHIPIQQQTPIAWVGPANVRPRQNQRQHQQTPVSWNAQAQAQGYAHTQPDQIGQQTRYLIPSRGRPRKILPQPEPMNQFPYFAGNGNGPTSLFLNSPNQQQIPPRGFGWGNNNGQPQLIPPIQMRKQNQRASPRLNNYIERSQSVRPEQQQFQQHRFQQHEQLRMNFPNNFDRPSSAPGWAHDQGMNPALTPNSPMRPHLFGPGFFNNGMMNNGHMPMPSPNSPPPLNSPWNEYSRPPPFEWRHPMMPQQQLPNMLPPNFSPMPMPQPMNNGQQYQPQNYIDPRHQFHHGGRPQNFNNFNSPQSPQFHGGNINSPNKPMQILSPQTLHRWQELLQQQKQKNVQQNFVQQPNNGQIVNSQPSANAPPSYGEYLNNQPNSGGLVYNGQHQPNPPKYEQYVVNNEPNQPNLPSHGQNVAGAVNNEQNLSSPTKYGQNQPNTPNYVQNMAGTLNYGLVQHRGEPTRTNWPVSSSSNIPSSSTNQNKFIFPTVSGNAAAGEGIPQETAGHLLQPETSTPAAPPTLQRQSLGTPYTPSGEIGSNDGTHGNNFGQIKSNNIINQGLGSGGQCINCGGVRPVSRPGPIGQSGSPSVVRERNDPTQPPFTNPTEPETRILPPPRIPVSFYSQAEVDAHYRRVHENHETAKDMEFENDRIILQQNLLRAKQILQQHKADAAPTMESGSPDKNRNPEADNKDNRSGNNISSLAISNGRESGSESERLPSPEYPISPRPADFGFANLSSNESISRLARGGRIRRQSSGIEYYVPEFY